MISLTALVAIFLFLSAHVDAHMWLRTPLSQGGLTSIGGTGGPCAGKAAGSGEVTTYEVGQSVNFQFRVNQHGPAPFKFALSTAGTTSFDVVLKDNIPNTVTAGADGFDGVNVQVTIPNNPCTGCVIQLSGMGNLDGSGKWYNCADVKIIPAGSRYFPKPSSLNPATGPTSGSTTITVTGTMFGNSSAGALNKCKFDDVIVPATWVSSTQMTCVAPARNQPGTAALEVSIDGVSFSSTGTAYTYTGDVILPVIKKIDPSSGRPGTLLHITGENFYSEAMLCKFNNITAHATVISETEATCMVPASAPYESMHVEVAVDNSPYSQSGKTFKVTVFSDNGKGSLTGGAKAGIAIGVLLIVGIVGAVGYLVYAGKIKMPSAKITPPSLGKSRV